MGRLSNSTHFQDIRMLIRKLVLFFALLCFSLSVQAQQPTPQDQADAQQLMLQKMEKVILSALTQKDVDVFLKVVDTSKALKLKDKTAWEAIDKLPPAEKEKKMPARDTANARV